MTHIQSQECLESEDYLDSVFNCTITNRTCFLVTDYIVHYPVATMGYCACENRIASVSSSIIGPPLGTKLKFSMSWDD